MKKVFLFAIALVIAAGSFANAPSEKALKAFNATFVDAENVVWSDAANIYIVRFTHMGIRTFVQYDEEGNFLSARRYYNADQLPVDILCKLKKNYPKKTLYGVTEYTVGDDINYYVKLEDEKMWMTVKVDNYRSMSVTEKYAKL
jgi:hypothetical protein